jgi:ABC-type multidrug transport system fused ATPase/permease subunit
VVGPSGAGKSTLALLLAGVYAPRAGRATVGGVDAHLIPPERLRQEIALVTQEHHLFAASIRDNLRLVVPDASDEELYAALDAVDAGDAVRALPDGLDTRIGSAGSVLAPGWPSRSPSPAWSWPTPTPWCSTRPPRCSTRCGPPPRAVPGPLLEGRTVIAISHRLHTANDADRGRRGGGRPDHRVRRRTTS